MKIIKLNKKDQKSRRRELRNSSTLWEHKLWNHLKNSQLDGLKFRRQQGIENYIVDFYCPKLKLIIEIEGGGHYKTENREADKVREKNIRTWGYKVLRYTNVEVQQNLIEVVEDIRRNCNIKNETLPK